MAALKMPVALSRCFAQPLRKNAEARAERKVLSKREDGYFFVVKVAVPSEPIEMVILPAARPATTESATS